MAVRAAELSEGGFSGRRLVRVKRATAPNTAIQKEDAIRSAQNAAHRLTKQMRIAAIEAELMRKEGKFFN